MIVGFIVLGALIGTGSAVFSLIAGYSVLFAVGVYALSGFSTLVVAGAGTALAACCTGPFATPLFNVFGRNK
ncbi:hypothetical protein [Actibacterium lipolyticum]|uniref:Uncharacterized protein n=1 Tax=Actibacterium lipolyticum TaxID=1524263 RepID=A0A238JJX2_9RHOB|nr:hypothetical protein [Actibacterium lipolyticum]SMX30703.1 hypothetical protein COL8621_00064 [Actibacterium lipolyticum]